MCSMNRGSRQKRRNTWAKTARCSGAADEAGLQRVVEVVLVGEADRLDGADRVDHPAGADRHAGLAQRAGEVGDVERELAVFGDGQVGVARHQTGPSSARASSRMRLASDPWSLAMSSWYLAARRGCRR